MHSRHWNWMLIISKSDMNQSWSSSLFIPYHYAIHYFPNTKSGECWECCSSSKHSLDHFICPTLDQKMQFNGNKKQNQIVKFYINCSKQIQHLNRSTNCDLSRWLKSNISLLWLANHIDWLWHVRPTLTYKIIIYCICSVNSSSKLIVI